ncbi:MAG: TonB-dependent receptor [Acidobacteriia bacterium]|nr:TonB-dependent receptor [Terriglobia bacterium]
MNNPMMRGILVLVFLSSAGAQTAETGAVSGTVHDPSGAVVAGAAVDVTNAGTRLTRSLRTDNRGSFVVGLLPPGDYSINVTADGFQKALVSGIHVQVTEVSVTDIALQVGSVTSEVNVSTTAELAQTTTAALGRVANDQVITGLPLANRNFTQILGLSPGVSVELSDAGQLGKNNQNVTANGVRPTFNNFQFNGIDANNIAENSATGFGPEVSLAVPAPDTIAEFKVQTGLYDASSGRSAGANVDIISKTGTNQLHGTAWEFLRNDDFNANTFFLNRNGQPRPVLKQNQYGFVLGGPIRKDKTFFFGSYQGTQQRNGLSTAGSASVFLPALTDDRSAAALGALFGGKAGQQGGVAVARDGSNINPISLKLLQFKLPSGQYLIPTPQVILPNGTGQSSFSSPAKFTEHQYTLNVDHNFSSNDTLSGRFFYSTDPQSGPFAQGNSSANVPGFGLVERDQNLMVALIQNHTFSPSMINQVSAGYTRFDGYHIVDQPISNSDIGLTPPTGLAVIPTIVVSNSFILGPPLQDLFTSVSNTFVAKDVFSWTKGRHYLRFGFEGDRRQVNMNLPFESNALLNFLSFQDFLLGMSAAQNGSQFSNLSSSAGDTGITDRHYRYKAFSTFAQDDFKVSTRLTINAGLRWEYFGPPSDTEGRVSNFDPKLALAEPPASGTLTGYTVPSGFPGTVPDGVTRTSINTLWNSRYGDFAPRVGAALRLLDKHSLVLRGGYGLYFQALSNQVADQSILALPLVVHAANSGVLNASASFAQPFVPALPPNESFPVWLQRTPTSAQAPTFIPSDLLDPHTQTYSVDLQYQPAQSFLLDVGYVGTRSSNLLVCLGFNQPLIASASNPVHGITTTSLSNAAQRVPILGLSSGASSCRNVGYANYNALQASLTKRFSKGLQFLASYTWSKNLDVASGQGSSEDLGGFSGDPTYVPGAYGPSDFDRTQRLVVSFVYEVPGPKSQSALLRNTLSHWSFSGILLAQSGVPFSVTDSRTGTIFARSGRAQCSGLDPNTSGSIESRLGHYINTAAFLGPPALFDGTGFGNCGRNDIRGPDQKNMDLAVSRAFPFHREGMAINFRAEAFNLTNHPNFGQPGSNLASAATFGVISTTVSNPRILQLALKFMY